jgi:hypothetical protein
VPVPATEARVEGFRRAYSDDSGAKAFHREPPAGADADFGGEAEPDGPG